VPENTPHVWIETSRESDGVHFRCMNCGLLAICSAAFTPAERRRWFEGIPIPCRASTSGAPEPKPKPDPPAEMPPLSECVKRYSKAVKRWNKAGRPVRSKARVKEIFETLCKPCKHYNAKRKRCRLCGCRASSGNLALLNKIKMATERCPQKKWLAEAQPPRKKK